MTRRGLLGLAVAFVAARGRAQAPDAAGVAAWAVEGHVLPGVSAFAAAAARLAEAARGLAAGSAERAAAEAAFHDAFDAWAAIAHLRFGPLERDNRAFAIQFWPDDRGATGRALARLLAAEAHPADYAAEPVSARGLMAVEQLLFEPAAGAPDAAGARRRALLAATAQDLAGTAAAVAEDWRAGAAAFSAPDRAADSARTLARALSDGLAQNVQRLERPLGTFERPAPRRAEAWRSGRSLRTVERSLAALRALAEGAFAPALTAEAAARVAAGFDAAERTVARIGTPLPQAVADPQGRVRVEAALSALRELGVTLGATAGAAAGAPASFNALDGD